jgi:hypothetical protein
MNVRAILQQIEHHANADVGVRAQVSAIGVRVGHRLDRKRVLSLKLVPQAPSPPSLSSTLYKLVVNAVVRVVVTVAGNGVRNQRDKQAQRAHGSRERQTAPTVFASCCAHVRHHAGAGTGTVQK